MNFIKLLSTIIIALAFVGCSVIDQPTNATYRPAQRTSPEEIERIQSENKIARSETHNTPTPNKSNTSSSKNKKAQQPLQAKTDEEPEEKFEEFAFDFSSRELEHIKFSYYDPFTKGDNVFTLDLNKNQQKFTFPLEKSRFSSGYGYRGRVFHSGIDLLEESGAPIYAAFDGVVRISKPYSGYGNVVVIRHNNGLETVYSHNSQNLVKPGDFVRSGDKIALVGRTGTATANHLHFEVRVTGQTFDPRLLVDLDNKTLQKGTLEIRRAGDKIMISNSKTGKSDNIRQTQPEPDKVITSSTPPKSTNSSKSAQISEAAKYHTIIKGDTLYGISRKYGVSTSSICKLNGISEKTILALGRKLRIK